MSSETDTLKKPSEIAQSGDVDGRDTGRPTDLKDIEAQAQKVKQNNTTVCCCIDPYMHEENEAYVPPGHCRDGDVLKHRVHFRTRVYCCNLCYNTESTTQNVILKASDGTVIKTVTLDDLSNPQMFFQVRSEKCGHKHHDLNRLSVIGRVLTYCCTVPGLLSTCKKLLCIEDCVTTENVHTVRCERTLFSRRHF
jgi:hypothetical protein